MKYTFLILITLFLKPLYSQKIQNYSGTYKNGNATFQYYNNTNNEKVLNGNFYYTSNKIEIKGKFQNNIKTGEWIYSRKNLDFNDNDIFIKGQYINGLKNGTWVFNRYFDTDGKKEEYNVTVNFLNDTLIGIIDFPNIKGQFSDTGKYIGKWIYKKTDEEDIVEFENNVVIKYTIKTLKDNKLTEIYNINKELIIDLEKNKTTELARMFFTNSNVKYEHIYGTNNPKNNRLGNDFKLSFELFNIGFREEVFNLLDISHFIEVDVVKVQKPEYLILRDKLISKPDESVHSFESSYLDKKAEFAGGEEKFMQLVTNSIILPDDENFSGGKMHLSYIIEKDGCISNIKFYEDLGFDINKQIEKILIYSPKWKPAMIDNQPVRVKNFLYLNLRIE